MKHYPVLVRTSNRIEYGIHSATVAHFFGISDHHQKISIMNTILGASGQVGSAVVANLVRDRQPVKGVVRDKQKASKLKKVGAEVAVADIHDESALVDSFKDATAVMVLTPESGAERDLLADTREVLRNYRNAVAKSPVKKIVGISSVGAQHKSGTGNLQMSYMLEHAFNDLTVEKIFVRPSYYFSNWLPYVDTVKKEGVLPTFFPPELSMQMISPIDVAAIIARLMTKNNNKESRTIYELEGPEWCSSNDVAAAFEEVLNRKVIAKQIPRSEWENTMKSMELSEDGLKNFIEMTEAVINGKAIPEKTNVITLRGETTLREYLRHSV
jgi:uncharacterized protein YbjT (DUF2867 family)